MTYKTHRQFAVFWAYAAAILIYIQGLSDINYYLALIIILPLAKLGAEFPDYDHIWANVKNKTPGTWVINKLIHLTGGKHRSWQTHSIDIAAVATVISFILPNKLLEIDKISNINKEILAIVLVGFASGWLSHLFSDMLTSGRVRLICFLNIQIGLVPKKLFGLRFNTGNEWEEFVFKVTRGLNVLAGLTTLVFPIFYDGAGRQILNKLLGGIVQ